MLKLTLYDFENTESDPQKKAEFNLILTESKPLILLGSNASCELVILDPTIAPNHLAISATPSGDITISDLESPKGSWLNSVELVPYKFVPLKPNDWLQVGRFLLFVTEVPDFPAQLSLELLPATDSALALPSETYYFPEAITTLKPRSFLTEGRIFWVYLVMITIAEYLTAIGRIEIGLVLHTGILVAVLVHGAVAEEWSERRLALSLAVAPLIRLLSMSLPLSNFPQLAWYGLVAGPLLLATWVIIRQLGLRRQELGLVVGRRGNLALQLMLAGGGMALGLTEYQILKPTPLLPNLNLNTVIPASLSLLIFTGFCEEIIFRGLLQATALPVLRKGALVYISLLFAVLHIGYLSLLDVIFVFAVGILFAYLVLWGGSILGVFLAHGLTNITLFIIKPYLSRNPDTELATALNWLTILGLVLSLLAIGILFWQGTRPDRMLGRMKEIRG